MKDNDLDGYLARQIGITAAQWELIANGAQHGARSAMIYFTALVAAGFTRDAALKILCAHGCSPKWPWASTTTRSDDDS
jgi:hypothetical protein